MEGTEGILIQPAAELVSKDLALDQCAIYIPELGAECAEPEAVAFAFIAICGFLQFQHQQIGSLRAASVNDDIGNGERLCAITPVPRTLFRRFWCKL
jgi:hypothetical protein